MVRVGYVRREREDHGRFRERAIRRFRQIQRRVQFDAIAHRNLNTPTEIIVGGRLRWRRRGSRRRRLRMQCCGDCSDKGDVKIKGSAVSSEKWFCRVLHANMISLVKMRRRSFWIRQKFL
ncbi:MAG: hypothetical protein DME92_04965 [Verrucomicrobia bacterium]|nr:MAG: hypothetical protein DME92_04965 [Verrucomicrobiota bacterium]